MKVPVRLISLTVCICVISHVCCSDINHNFTSSSTIGIVSKSEDAEGWSRLAKEAGLDEAELVVTSQEVQLKISKRSDSDSETTEKPPKKKPIMYSWWMPNMASGGQTANAVTTPSADSDSEPQTTERTTKPSTGKRPRPTRKPKATLRPRTLKPSLAEEDPTESPKISTTSQPSKPSPTTSVSKVNPTSSTTTSTEPSPSYFQKALTIKKKLVNLATIVGGVALIAKGTAGQLAVSTTGVDPYLKVAGKVGSLAYSAGTLAAPVAKNVAVQAGSLAASAISQAGSLAVSGAGRAYEALSTRIASQQIEDCKKVNLKSENDAMVIKTPVMTTRDIKTSPHPHVHKVEHMSNSTDPDVEMDVVMNTKKHSVDAKHPLKSEPKTPKSSPETIVIKTQDVPTMRMSSPNSNSFSVSAKAELLVIFGTLVIQLFLNQLYSQ